MPDDWEWSSQNEHSLLPAVSLPGLTRTDGQKNTLFVHELCKCQGSSFPHTTHGISNANISRCNK